MLSLVFLIQQNQQHIQLQQSQQSQLPQQSLQAPQPIHQSQHSQLHGLQSTAGPHPMQHGGGAGYNVGMPDYMNNMNSQMQQPFMDPNHPQRSDMHQPPQHQYVSSLFLPYFSFRSSCMELRAKRNFE
jgi:hypothetical protein